MRNYPYQMFLHGQMFIMCAAVNDRRLSSVRCHPNRGIARQAVYAMAYFWPVAQLAHKVFICHGGSRASFHGPRRRQTTTALRRWRKPPSPAEVQCLTKTILVSCVSFWKLFNEPTPNEHKAGRPQVTMDGMKVERGRIVGRVYRVQRKQHSRACGSYAIDSVALPGHENVLI